MKTILKTVLCTLAIGALALMPLKANAQSSPEPAVVISVAKMQEQLADAKYLVEAAGFGQMSFFINTFQILVCLHIDQDLKGVDDSK